MDNTIHNSETPEASLELFDTDSLPSLDALMLELVEDDEETAPQQQRAGNLQATSQSALEAEIETARTHSMLLTQENEELRTALEGVQSNFDKFRWRADRDRSEHYTFAVISVVRELLPVLDNFGRALDNAEMVLDEDAERQDFPQFVHGVRLIEQQIFKVLGGMGVELIQAVGKPFDPTYHEAVAAEPSADVPPNTVIAEVLRGFRLGDKLVRASMVKVSTQG